MLTARELIKRPFRWVSNKRIVTAPPLAYERRQPAPVVAYIGPNRRVNAQDSQTDINTPPAPTKRLL